MVPDVVALETQRLVGLRGAVGGSFDWWIDVWVTIGEDSGDDALFRSLASGVTMAGYCCMGLVASGPFVVVKAMQSDSSRSLKVLTSSLRETCATLTGPPGSCNHTSQHLNIRTLLALCVTIYCFCCAVDVISLQREMLPACLNVV